MFSFAISALLTTSVALAHNDHFTFEKRVSPKCDLQESDVVPKDSRLRQFAKRWLAMKARKTAVKDEELFKTYLKLRYNITSEFDANSLEEAAFVAGVEDLPLKLRQEFKRMGVGVSDFAEFCDVSLLYTNKFGNTNISLCPKSVKAKKRWDFTSLKQLFVHEMGHAYAIRHGHAHLKDEWKNICHWFREDSRDTKEDCAELEKRGVKDLDCGDWFFPFREYQIAGKRDVQKELKNPPLPGFVSLLATQNPAEDYAESFTQFRYSQSFYDRANTDEKLKTKLQTMKKIFGTSYESEQACVANGDKFTDTETATTGK